MKSTTYHWHQLDPTAGGYISAHVGEGDSFQVFTTPISLQSQAEHRLLIDRKINGEDEVNDDECLGYDPDDYCDKCGSSTYWEDCWKCGGEGGRDGEDLMEEDPLWYSPDDFETCDVCEGKRGWNMCLNSECKE